MPVGFGDVQAEILAWAPDCNWTDMGRALNLSKRSSDCLKAANPCRLTWSAAATIAPSLVGFRNDVIAAMRQIGSASKIADADSQSQKHRIYSQTRAAQSALKNRSKG